MTSASDTRPGRLRRLAASLAQSKSDLHAATLRAGVADLGVTPIAECVPGEQVTVTGVLRSVTLRPRDRVPAVEAELFDGSGRVLVVWLGRRRIHGIDPGRALIVTGRITRNREHPTIHNPRYELLAPTSSS